MADIFEATVGENFAGLNHLEDNNTTGEKMKDVLLESVV